jgi:hypothetical protein
MDNEVIEMETFSRFNQKHMNLLKGLYFAWYGPKAAKAVLAEMHIKVAITYIAQMYRSFRVAQLPRYNRLAILKQFHNLPLYPQIDPILRDELFQDCGK